MAEEQTPNNGSGGVTTEDRKPLISVNAEAIATSGLTTSTQYVEDEPRSLPQRDGKGKFKPKPNPEFTLAHFWLEIMEIAIGILIAQVIWEGGVWLIR